MSVGLDGGSEIAVVDMHTGGEPVRIPVSGLPDVPGDTILAKRRHARDQLDHIRRFLMFEPRGHRDMYGAWLVKPSLPGADLAVLFLHNEGYSTMCGHAVIALARFAVDRGLVKRMGALTRIGIECPCGLVEAFVDESGAVVFDSVPAFVLARNVTVDLPDKSRITCDVAYGGAFYAIADAGQLGLNVTRDRVSALTDAADAVTKAVRAALNIIHPVEPDLGFLYGTILTDGDDGVDRPSVNICVFADREVDRSPTGSGVTARMALYAATGRTTGDRIHRFQSVTGAIFTGEARDALRYGGYPAFIVRVGGKAHYTGEARFRLEPDDAIGRGFLLK
jgi:proline racemase